MSEPVEAIRIDGLRSFVRGLKAIDKDLPKATRIAGNTAAGIVVDEAEPRVPRRSGRAAASIRAKSTRTAARVAGGKKSVPYFGWLDFGGRVGRNRSVKRPFIKSGRYIWASYSDKKDDVQDTLRDALVKIARDAGIEVDE